MSGQEMYNWFEEQLRQQIPDAANRYQFQQEATVTLGVELAQIRAAGQTGKALLKTDLRPEGVRMYFPLEWQAHLSEWLGVPPADAYRLKSNWVHQPSIGVGTQDFDPFFKNLAQEIIKLLK